MKKLLIIGGGKWQLSLIKSAKQAGHWVAVTNLFKDSPGFQYADKFAEIDIADKEATLDFAKKIEPDAVLSDQSDLAVPTVAFISEKLGLPGIGIKQATLFTNKLRMREFCEVNGLPVPKYFHAQDKADAIRTASTFPLPMIIKPISGHSSKGVTKIDRVEEIEEAIDNVILQGKSGGFLIEEFIEGEEFTVEGLKLPGENHVTLGISYKKHFSENEMVASQLWYDADRTDVNYDQLIAQHNQMIDKMGLEYGLTHAEYKFRKNSFYLIEVAARGGGTNIPSTIMSKLNNIDLNQILISLSLKEKLPKVNELLPAKKQKALLHFFKFSPGKIKNIKNIQAATKIRGVVELEINVQAGSEIPKITDDSKRHGYAILIASSLEDLKNTLINIERTIKIEYV